MSCARVALVLGVILYATKEIEGSGSGTSEARHSKVLTIEPQNGLAANRSNRILTPITELRQRNAMSDRTTVQYLNALPTAQKLENEVESYDHKHNFIEARSLSSSKKKPRTAETFPFVVSVQLFTKNNYKHLCGGTIIDEEFVLTAAHCVLKPKRLPISELSVVGGSHQLYQKTPMQRFKVRAMKSHPNFKPLYGADIVVLQVVPKFPIDNASFASLSIKGKTRKGGGSDVLLVGWGRAQQGKTKDLQTIHFRTLNDDECVLKHRFKYLTHSEICAVNTRGARSACDGDSGGPLISPEFSLLYGFLSYGRKVCQPGHPFAFTRISTYVKWIEDQMAQMKNTK